METLKFYKILLDKGSFEGKSAYLHTGCEASAIPYLNLFESFWLTVDMAE